MSRPIHPVGIAERLDLDVYELGICHACLGFVASALDSGDEREIRRWVDRMTPDLWAEGLALPVRAALERARRRGDPDADAAIFAVEAHGARSLVVKAIVRRLAEDMQRRVREELAREFPEAPVLPLPRPP